MLSMTAFGPVYAPHESHSSSLIVKTFESLRVFRIRFELSRHSVPTRNQYGIDREASGLFFIANFWLAKPNVTQ